MRPQTQLAKLHVLRYWSASVLCVGLLISLWQAAMAQPYKWVDENGRTVYSDTPPDPKLVKKVSKVNAAPASGTGSGEVTVAEKLKKSDNAKKTAGEANKKAEDESKVAEAKSLRCKDSKSNLAILEAGGRIFSTNAKGERELMSDEQIATSKKQAEATVAEACAEK